MEIESPYGVRYKEIKTILDSHQNIPLPFLLQFFSFCIPLSVLSRCKFRRSKKELCRCLDLLPDYIWNNIITNPSFILQLTHAYEKLRKKTFSQKKKFKFKDGSNDESEDKAIVSTKDQYKYQGKSQVKDASFTALSDIIQDKIKSKETISYTNFSVTQNSGENNLNDSEDLSWDLSDSLDFDEDLLVYDF